MKKKTKTQNLSSYIMKKYILFSLTLLLGIAIFTNVMVAYQKSMNGVDIKEYFCAELMVRPDYENIDISRLQDLNGWIEILDENYKVIYTKGTVLEKKASYTVKELLAQASDQRVNKNKIIFFGNFKITIGNTKEERKFLATYANFTGLDGKPYICISKLPSDKLQTSYTIMNPTGASQEWIKKTILITFLGIISIFLLLLFIYSHIIKKHIIKPVDMLIDGLEDITSGNYDKKLDFKAEHEFEKMRKAFNYMAKEMQIAKKKQESFDSERQQLFSNIAHDIKTPITTITGCSRALMEGLVTDNAKRHQYMENIYRKSTRVNELINLLFEYTKLDNNKYRFNFEQGDIAELVREIVADFYEEIEGNQMELKLDIPEDTIIINMDKIELRRAISNLVVNVIKHNPANTKLYIGLKPFKAENKDPLKGTSKDSTMAHINLELSDNGTSIPADIKETIFEPFVMGNKSRTSNHGSGLGLSISKKIIEKHQGKLSLMEKADGWKSFVIEL